MTTGDDKAREEYERLMREVQLANVRETHRLLTSAWQQKASAIAAGIMVTAAVVALLSLVGIAHQVLP
jgi:ABC-type arginine transport system ATPase subunit